MYLSERELSKEKKNLLKKIWAKCCLNVLQNFSMRKIHPKWEKTSKATWSCAKSGMFCFRKKSSSFFLKKFPRFFSWKNTTCLSILILTLWNTTLNNTREFFILKNICKKKPGKIFGGRNSLFLTRVFCFQNSVFSVSHYFPHLAVPVFEQKRAKTKVWLFIIFLLSVLLIPLLKFGMWLFQFPPHF